jgi:cytochrome P450
MLSIAHRVCPGQHFAEANIWLAMSSVIASFDILKPVDVHGKEYTPEPVFIQEMTT